MADETSEGSPPAVALPNTATVRTERRRADEELAAERERLRITLNSIGDAVISTDAEGRVVFLNPVAEVLTGWTQCEAAGRPLPDVFRIVNEYTHQPVENPAFRALREGIVVGLANHTLLVARDGTERPIDDSAAPIRDSSGASTGAVLVFRDVTERRRAESERARLAAIIESSDDAIISKTHDGVIQSWNAGAERLFGFAAAEAIGRPITLIVPPERLDEERMIVERLSCGERIDHYETVRVAKNGRRLDVSLTVSPLRDAEGRVVGASKVARDITDHKRAEAALRESETQLRFVLDHAPVYLARCGTDCRFRFVNRSYAARFGLKAEDFVGKSISEMLGEQAYESFRTHIDEVLAGQRVAFEVEVPYQRGGPRFMHCVYEPERDSAGCVDGWIAVITDFTDRRQVESALRESESRFRLLAETAPSVIWTAAPDGTITYANERWFEYCGVTPERNARNWPELVLHPDDRDRCVEAWTRALSEGSPYEIEVRNRRHDGAYRWFVTRAVPARDQAGRVVQWFGTTIDIDDRKRAEQTSRFLANASAALAELTDYESTLQKVASLAVPFFADWCAVDMQDTDGTLRRLAVTHTDPAKVALAHEVASRYPPDPDDPRGVWKVLRTGDPEWVPLIPDALLEQSARDPEHLRIIRELGLRSYLCVPLKSRGRVLGALTFATAESGRMYDADDLRSAEDLAHRAVIAIENATLVAALRDADRRKDEFIALLAHELRNPLAPIRNGLEVLRIAGGLPEEAAKARDRMERQLSHLVRVVDDLLDVSRISRGKMELRRARVRLSDVIGSAVETARPVIDAAGHELEVCLPDEPVTLDVDLTRLAQVVANLLTNSAKYTPAGGRIRLAAAREGGEVVVTVRDNGIGIPADMLARIFDMFSQVERSIEKNPGGLGIGLALVKGLVEIHGGRVAAESPGPGAGSTFTVRLPLTPLESRRAEADEPPARRPAGGDGRRILIVDDSRDGADSMAEMLRLLGHTVFTAHDGLEAVEAAARLRPELILMDVGMPLLNGLDATRRIREQPWGKGVTIVALTGWGQDADRERSRDAGCDGHLVKPVGLDELEPVLTGLSHRGT